MLSYKNTAKEIRESTAKTVLIPIGSIEQHSSHLPTGTDLLIVTGLAERLAERMDAYLLPTLPISTCYEHKHPEKNGTVWMRPTTFLEMLKDIILSLKGQGFCRFVLLMGHGGVWIAGPAIRELNALYDGVEVIKVAEAPYPAHLSSVFEGDGGIHADEFETSLMLYLHEDLVDKERMRQNDFLPDCPQEFLNYTSLLDISPTGAWGKPSLGTKEKGEKAMAIMVEDCLTYIEKAFQYTKPQAW